jgi:hypothetical protein
MIHRAWQNPVNPTASVATLLGKRAIIAQRSMMVGWNTGRDVKKITWGNTEKT